MRRTVSSFLTVIVGAIFIYAGIIKALDPARFAGDIGNFQILPWHAAVVVALYLPWLEIVCGAALVFRKCHAGALVVLVTLCVVFLAALASAKARGLDISCGCFGHGASHSLTASIGIDLGILAVLVFLLRDVFRRDEEKGGAGSRQS